MLRFVLNCHSGSSKLRHGPHLTSLPPILLPAEAQDRAFRLGQRRDVSVYRFVAAGGPGSAGLQDEC